MTLEVAVRPSESLDVAYLAEHLRPEDRREIYAYSGRGALEALEGGFQNSLVPWTATADSAPCAMFGVVPAGEVLTGAIWLLGTPDIERIKVPFIRGSKVWLETVHQPFDLTFNLVDARNKLHIRWLRWLGYRFLRLHEEFGVEKRPFYEFARMRNV